MTGETIVVARNQLATGTPDSTGAWRNRSPERSPASHLAISTTHPDRLMVQSTLQVVGQFLGCGLAMLWRCSSKTRRPFSAAWERPIPMNLSKSNKLNATKEGSLPEDLAFLAMTQHQLGKKDEAKTTLGGLQEIMKQPRWAQDTESVGFLREAEEPIEGKALGKRQ
jgi:hypothetical protein